MSDKKQKRTLPEMSNAELINEHFFASQQFGRVRGLLGEARALDNAKLAQAAEAECKTVNGRLNAAAAELLRRLAAGKGAGGGG